MFRRAAVCAFALTLAGAPAAGASQLPTTTLSISQVYGGGGTMSGVYSTDFVEIHNVSRTSQPVTGYSVQYASATGSTWGVTQLPPMASIPPGGYLLVALGSPGPVGAPLPTPDVANSAVAVGSGAGKVALVAGTTALTCGGLANSCAPAPTIIDYVGYGGSIATVSDFETMPAPALSGLLAAMRRDNGCTDTQNNSDDFTATTPVPRNSATAPVVCNNAPVYDPLASPYTVAEGSTLTFSVTATDADGDPVTISAPTAPSGTNAASYDANTHIFTWTPDSSRAAGSPYTVVFAANDGHGQALTSVLINVTDVPQQTAGSGSSSSGGETTTTSTSTPTSTTAPTTGAPLAQTPAPDATTPSTCVVPRLRGLTLKQAKAKLVKARCALGKVTKKPAKRSLRGKVVAQTRKAGARAPRGTKVGLTLGR